MNGNEMSAGMEVLGKYGALTITAEHDQVWLHIKGVDWEDRVEFDEEEGESRLLDPSPLTQEEADALQALGWFVDSEVCSWTHFC